MASFHGLFGYNLNRKHSNIYWQSEYFLNMTEFKNRHMILTTSANAQD